MSKAQKALSVPFDHLAMVNAKPQRIANAAMSVLDRLQRGFKSHEQALALAAVFLLLCEGLKVEPQDVMTTIKNLLVRSNDGHGSPEFWAMRAYIQMEMME